MFPTLFSPFRLKAVALRNRGMTQDPEALAEALSSIIAEPERAGALAAAAREDAANHHTWRSRAGLILERVG